MLASKILIGAAALMLGVSNLAAQTVDRETVQTLRKIAIEEGQTSGSAIKAPARSPEAIEAERQSIERHRVSFFARVYGGAADSEADRESAALPGASVLLLTPAMAPKPVSREILQALRRIAIEEGQTSGSAVKAPAKSPEVIAAEQLSIERHRAEFFARAYGRVPGV